ncbi:MAG: efflux RND transporter periplasmic adaptor subunit, partial [Gammaproteobacteria bacterium]|nr:efflux RND transporter periplasmic adaptor subunit [Gammaproteobacteria bacterium]
MKNLVLLALLALAIVAGFAIGSWWQPEQGNGQTDAGRERRILYWKAPMDPNYRRDAPGKSPMGMDLVPVYADEAAGQAPGVVAIDPVVVNNLGIRTAPVEYGVLNRQINTVGYVAYDEDTLRQVNTRVDGWVEKLGVTAAGDPVERGQVLFEFYSPALVNAQQEYLATMRSSNAKLKKATRERLIALGISTSEISRLEKERTVRQRQRVYASRDGVVTQLGIRQGSYITPATNIMAIASLDQVWLLAEVFERQAAWISAGQPAEVELEHLPGQKHEGTLDYIYPQLDPTTRTLQ